MSSRATDRMADPTRKKRTGGMVRSGRRSVPIWADGIVFQPGTLRRTCPTRPWRPAPSTASMPLPFLRAEPDRCPQGFACGTGRRSEAKDLLPCTPTVTENEIRCSFRQSRPAHRMSTAAQARHSSDTPSDIECGGSAALARPKPPTTARSTRLTCQPTPGTEPPGDSAAPLLRSAAGPARRRRCSYA